MRLAVLFSGGKDSTLALHRAMQEGHSIECLVSIYPRSPASWMFHYPNISVTELQAKAMGIPIMTKETLGRKEEELEDLRDALEQVSPRIDGVVSGALASKYQKSRVDRIAESLGLQSLAPLWGDDPERMWKELIGLGFRVMITGVACEGLGREWLGRTVNLKVLEELKALSVKHQFHLGFEGGEAETMVTDGPIFKQKLEIQEADREWSEKEGSGLYRIRKVKLAAKDS
jgi:ABC transporter with metal-binding/Fe-S-binding domain ATP-binding protein